MATSDSFVLEQSPPPPYTITPAPSNEQPAFAGEKPSPLGIIGVEGEPWEGDQDFLDTVAEKIYSCPSSPAGDYAFFRWLYDFCVSYAAGGMPAAPTLATLSPAEGVANTDATVAISGTGFDAGATVDVAGTTLTPEAGGTATGLSVIIPAASLAAAGSVDVAVKNSDGQWSNALAFTIL